MCKEGSVVVGVEGVRDSVNAAGRFFNSLASVLLNSFHTMLDVGEGQLRC